MLLLKKVITHLENSSAPELPKLEKQRDGRYFSKDLHSQTFHLSEDVLLGEQDEKFKSTEILFSETFFFEVSYKSANTSLEEIMKNKVHVIFILRQVMFRK